MPKVLVSLSERLANKRARKHRNKPLSHLFFFTLRLFFFSCVIRGTIYPILFLFMLIVTHHIEREKHTRFFFYFSKYSFCIGGVFSEK